MESAYTRQSKTEGKKESRDGDRKISGEKLTLPNSVISRIMDIPGAESGAGGRPAVPNNVISRIMELPKAEAEADRLSEGVTSGTPTAVRREMGGRLGADFSGVHFHSGPSSVRQSEALGAQAWTQGRDIYFGRGGFTPSLAAHELVHTVQQGAVRGNVSQSMPAGSVQLKTGKGKNNKKQLDPGLEAATAKDFQIKEEDAPLQGDVGDLSAIERQLIETFSTSRGLEVYNAIRFDLHKMIAPRLPKRSDGQSWIVKFRPKSASSFLVRAAYQDYALRDILTEIVGKGVGLFKTGVRIRQYKALIQSVSDRLGPYQIKELASQAGILMNEPRADRRNNNERRVNKRSYELDVEDPETDKFNPGNIPEVAEIQEEIDNAETFEEAYKIFAKFTGNQKATVEYENPAKDEGVVTPDLELFKKKLKHMSRQIWDYPELRKTIGNLMIFDSARDAKMGMEHSNGGRERSDIYYSAFYDRAGAEGEEQRQTEDAERREAGEWNGDSDHNGNHELGHLLGFNMTKRNDSYKEAKESNTKAETENDIVKEVLLNRDILTPQQKKQIKFHKSAGYAMGKYERLKHYKGQVDLQGSPALEGNAITSNYGKSAVYEFFAETFADTYTHGTNAKRASIEVVKEYEKRQKALQRAKYKYNQSNWFMKLFRKKASKINILPSGSERKKLKQEE